MTDYLPKDATIEQACAWLHARTGETWVLSRLLECHLTPHFWLDYAPGYPQIFGDRIEGYQTRMVFQGDLCRLESDGAAALVNMYESHDGSLLKSEPGLRVPLNELRFKREAIERVAEIVNASKQSAPATEAGQDAPVSRRSLWDVVTPYILEIMRAGQYANAKQLFNSLEAKAGQGSPFDKGVGPHRGSLYVRDSSAPLALKTMQNNWQKLLTEAAKK